MPHSLQLGIIGQKYFFHQFPISQLQSASNRLFASQSYLSRGSRAGVARVPAAQTVTRIVCRRISVRSG